MTELSLSQYLKIGFSVLKHPSYLYTMNIHTDEYAARFKNPAIRWALEHAQPGPGNLFSMIFSYATICSNDCAVPEGGSRAFAERILKERQKAQTNWREVLNNFVQEDINDYSFNPPDRRFSDSIFMLPDLNEPTETVKNVLFMIDTSGSMSDDMIAQAYQEIRGAIDQFGGKLEGYLGFFDAVVVPPIEFSTIEELDIIRPYGGGGTKFSIIFDYVNTEMKDEPPTSIVILTDGYAPFPKESIANDIPVLWVINNDEVVPPWGKHTVITV
jgi:predicted metal-dependent peptidase